MEIALLSDKEIVEQVLDGSVESYSLLVARWGKAACGTAAHILRDWHLVEDVGQDAMVKAFEKLGTLKNTKGFGAWVMQISRNLALDELRKKKRHKEHCSISEIGDVADGKSGVLDDEQSELLEAVMKLPDHEKQIVMLKFFEGYTIKKIAEITGRPGGTVSRQLSRAYDRLRKKLKGGLI